MIQKMTLYVPIICILGLSYAAALQTIILNYSRPGNCHELYYQLMRTHDNFFSSINQQS